jgi:prepilin-type N-terminal cleavage/methylation domain-containing protein
MNKRHKESIIVSVKKKEAVIINKDGFTLLEILAAMSIMAISMLALATMQFAVVRNNLTGNQFTSAIEITREQIELLKNEDVITSALLSPTPLAGAQADNPIEGVYTCPWAVNDYWFDSDGDGVDETLSAFGRRLSVTVTWIKQGPGGGNRTVTLQSLTLGSGM